MADLEQKFQEAAKSVNDLKSRPNDEELLCLYGLYKQATVGDCNQSKPGMFQLKEKAKHEAWLSKKGMNQDQAKQEYIDTCEKMKEKYGLK